MASGPTAQQPSPELFFDVIRRSNDAAALKTAVELDLFTAIAEGNRTSAALAGRCQASEKGMRILCDALVIIGFLNKTDGRYTLTPDSAAFLDRRSPAFVGTAVGFLTTPLTRQGFEQLAEAVRKGGTALPDQSALGPEHPIWVEFARGMAPLMRLPAGAIAAVLKAHEGQAWRVLDIAAGHGVFGITIAEQNRNAQITAVDWANVLEVAWENAQQAGVAARYRRLPGSAFEVDYGSGFDIALLTNFLHHFDVPTCEGLLRKVYAALVPGGRAVVLDFIPNPDRVSPPAAAKFSLSMLALTPGGDAYTFPEYERMLRSAGFGSATLHPIPPSPQQMVVALK
jgi:SAM-dependent methyltransferase